MFYLAGLIRSTILYLALTSLFTGVSTLIDLVVFYLIISLVHIGICKLKKDERSVVGIFTGALCHDIIAPFLHTKSCIEVLLKKHIIRDTPDHMFEDRLQTYSGGIWGICILFLLLFSFIAR